MKKYANFYAGFQFVVTDNGMSCPWEHSNNVFRWLESVVANGNEKINTSNKAMKQFNLDAVNTLLESVYYDLVEVVAIDNATSKEERKSVADNFYFHAWTLYRALGCNDSGRDFLWNEEYTLLRNCIATTASSKTVLSRTGRRVNVTGFTTFKNAFWNAFFNAVTNRDVLVTAIVSEKKKAFLEKQERRLAKAAKKA